jgi:DNA-binding NarL/FixJ family response regulator
MIEKILIADDHGVVRLGLALMIKKLRSQASIDEVDNYHNVLEAIKRIDYNLVILDINMPNGTFQETLEIIKIRNPKTKVMVFSSQDENLYAIRYLKMGADGFLHKLAPEEGINRALEKMLNKGSYISEEIKDTMIFNTLNKSTPVDNPLELLSDREIEIAERLIKGAPLKDISNELNLHVSSVSTYKTRIFKKLDIQSIPELIEVFKFHENLKD